MGRARMATTGMMGAIGTKREIRTARLATGIITLGTTNPARLTPSRCTMDARCAEWLSEKFGCVTWVPRRVVGLPEEGWFLLETSPCPPVDERLLVISDINRNDAVSIINGKVRHSEKCVSCSHEIAPRLLRVVEAVEDTTFRVAVYPGSKDLLLGQPVAISLEPGITYEEFPDHFHLNAGGDPGYGMMYLPDSLCYTDRPEKLGVTECGRLDQAFAWIIIWLFRHQIWLATGEQGRNGIWIGPHVEGFKPEHYVYLLNPLGRCRCGSSETYADCHMPSDLIAMSKGQCSLQDARTWVRENREGLFERWLTKVSTPQNRTLQALRSALL